MRRIPIWKGYYEVDDAKKEFRFLSRNKYWSRFSDEKNEANQRSIDGYYRINKDGTRKKYEYGKK